MYINVYMFSLLTSKKVKKSKQQGNFKMVAQDIREILQNFQLNDNKIIERYKCLLCGNILRDPIQTFRGNVACKICYEDQIRNGICPIDKMPITMQEFFNDKARQNEIQNLGCHCKYRSNGCSWAGKIKEAKSHICQYKPQICCYCNDYYEQQYEFDHFESCNGIYKIGPCIFKRMGCSFEAETKDQMDYHLKNQGIYHLLYQLDYQQRIDNENKNNIMKYKQQVEQQKENEQILKDKVNKLEHLVLESHKQFEEYRKRTDEQLKTFKEMLNTSHQTSSTTTNSSVLQSNPPKVPKVPKELSKLIQNNMETIRDINLRVQLNENTTHDGRLLWKIDNFKKRRNDAISCTITALHSAPSFTHKYGYRFCSRVYFNGDGIGKGTHLSLYIVIMKSEYDNLLEWPFQKQIKFTLLNQRDSKRNVTKVIQPSIESVSFQKPVREMNNATGCPKFIELNQLDNGFLKDDSLYIDIEVK